MHQIDFQGLSVLEKLKLIEDVWEDLLKNEDQVPSPAWHETILAKRSEDFKQGKERVLNWKKAKEEILERINGNKDS